jgi:hypothetical protein
MGKRSVLDSFFARLDKELQAIFPDATVRFAYGSAGLTMKASGKNRVTVPTIGAYKAACRIFRDRCEVQDERFTTKVDFSTGKVKHAVYMMPGGKLGDTDKRCMPQVKPEDREAVKEMWRKILERNKRRRGGGRIDETDRAAEGEAEKPKNYQSRYPELRSLRYLPSTRTYFGRDDSAAKCIARLAAYRFINGAKKKPSPFCSCRQPTVKEEEDGEPAEHIVV